MKAIKRATNEITDGISDDKYKHKIIDVGNIKRVIYEITDDVLCFTIINEHSH